MSSRRRWLISCVVVVFAFTSCTSETDTPSTSTQGGAPESTQTTTTTTTTADGASTTMLNPTTTQAGPATTDPSEGLRVLVFYRTEGFTHQSIGAGIEAFEQLSSELDFELMTTDDNGRFNSDELESHDVVVFLNTTGDVLDAEEQEVMEGFIASGGGFVGIHSATDTEYEWPWYGGLVGAYFDGHPAVQPAVVEVVEPTHPVVAGLTPRFERTDEWYNFDSVPGPEVTVLMTVDETTYDGGGMGDFHPITWVHEYGGGRSFYTGFGHTAESFEEPMVRRMLANAILWAAGE